METDQLPAQKQNQQHHAGAKEQDTQDRPPCADLDASDTWPKPFTTRRNGTLWETKGGLQIGLEVAEMQKLCGV